MAEEDKTEQCQNCKKPISKSNYTIHILHCQRNFSVCKKCNDVFPVNQLKDHLETAHKNVKCQLCSLELENYKIEEHENNCPKRLVQCVYCDLEVPCDGLNDHENYCGSRTELCGVCKQYVMLRDQETHKASGHLPVDKKTNTNNNSFSPVWNDFTTDRIVSIPPFTSKKENIESDLFTRQSPSKRNNDMPQVNTSFPHDWKEPEKRNINSLETDSPSNNLDRMLAMQMQEMDESMAPDSSDYLKHAQIFSENLMNPSTLLQDPFDLNPDLVWSHQPLDDIFQSDPDFLRESFNQLDQANINEPENGLPCEFCGDLYPADLLILHESGCCPDIAHGLKPDEFIDEKQELKTNLFEPIDKIEPSDINVAMLPCKHCNELFPSEILREHEEICLAGVEFLRDLNSSSSPPPLTPRRYSDESMAFVKPKIHKCPSLNSSNKSVNLESKPPADHKFSDLTRTRNDPLLAVNRTGQIARNVNEYHPNHHQRRSSDTYQLQKSVNNVGNINPTNLPRRLSHLDKGHGENKNVNITKTKPSATSSYLQEMKYNLKRPQERPNLVVTGAKPKSMSESSRPPPLNNTSQGNRSWVPVREQTTENTPGNYVPSYCHSNDGQLESAYRRFLAQQRAQHGTNSQQRPKLKQTGAVPKTSRKSSSEE